MEDLREKYGFSARVGGEISISYDGPAPASTSGAIKVRASAVSARMFAELSSSAIKSDLYTHTARPIVFVYAHTCAMGDT